ncbi:SO_0444 family Cu/Zn efflux transporter [Sulfurimonas sp.]
MFEYFIEYFSALVELSNAMAPYILFGLVFAGVLHELVPQSIVKNHLGKNSLYSVIKATLFGIPLPVCSCGVIPLAAGIKKSGASNGSTLAFLISTPITGVDSILATYGVFGWIFTLYRVVTSMIISIIAGVLTNIYTQKEEKIVVDKPESCSEASCCSSSCESEKRSFRMSAALVYAFSTLLKDIASPLFIGLLLGALITVAIPNNLSEILLQYNWLSYIIVIIIAVPMYVCATASLPIAAGLMLAGVSPGAAFVFLSAGPATNTVTIGVVKKMLGERTLYVYLGTIVVGSIVFGLGLDYIFKDVDVRELVHVDENFGIFTLLSSLILWAFVLYYMIKPYFFKENECEDGSCCSS